VIQRFDKLAVELPVPTNASPNDASAVQELLGGKFGEMSTLMNYTFQSFNFRGRKEMRPFYDLVANIAAEEFGHIEVLSYAINMMLTGATRRARTRRRRRSRTASTRACSSTSTTARSARSRRTRTATRGPAPTWWPRGT
jgi:Mn-containing catalase